MCDKRERERERERAWGLMQSTAVNGGHTKNKT